jgi:hypothetical protein
MGPSSRNIMIVRLKLFELPNMDPYLVRQVHILKLSVYGWSYCNVLHSSWRGQLTGVRTGSLHKYEHHRPTSSEVACGLEQVLFSWTELYIRFRLNKYWEELKKERTQISPWQDISRYRESGWIHEGEKWTSGCRGWHPTGLYEW